MSDTFQWSQAGFDATLKEYLMAHESRVWPKLINKKAFYVALGAFQVCQHLQPLQIGMQLDRMVTATREDGTTGQAKIGNILAAKRASGGYTSSARFQRQAGRDLAKAMGGRGAGGDYGDAWRRQLREFNKSLYGGRKASVGFLRAGFVSIVYQLGPIVGDNRRVNRFDTKIRGSVKGSVLHLAREGDLSITIENRAHSRTEKLGGFERVGGAAMQTAVNVEQLSMLTHMEKEMEPEIEAFNAKQH